MLSLLSTDGLAKAKLGFLDRLILAEACGVNLPLVTFENTSARLPGVEVLKMA